MIIKSIQPTAQIAPAQHRRYRQGWYSRHFLGGSTTLVTTAEDESARTEAVSSGLLRGTQVLRDLVMPWARTGHIVAADSYFASVESAEVLYKAGLRFIRVDRERRYFVSTCSSLAPGTLYMRKRLRQVSMESNAPPEVVELTVPQPQAAEIYYSACAMIAGITGVVRMT
jgi:hypothetical protein